MPLQQLFTWSGLGAEPRPGRPAAINQYTIKFLVGVIAIILPLFERALTQGWITSISESYWYPSFDWPRTVLTGFLFAITALLFGFNGDAPPQGLLARIAAVSAALIALFPCACRCGIEIIPRVHYIAAGVMYAVLTWFILHFYLRAHEKAVNHPHPDGRRNARRRRLVYAACLLLMVASLLVLVLQKAIGPDWRPVLFGEAGGLIAFGVSWITASRSVLSPSTHGIDREKLF